MSRKPNTSTLHAADKLFFAEQAKLKEKMRGLKRLEKHLARLEWLAGEIVKERDNLEALGLKRSELINSLEPSEAARKILRSNTPHTSAEDTPETDTPQSSEDTQNTPNTEGDYQG